MEQALLKLDGRIIVVAGAAGGGIGTSATRMLAEAGATVVAVSRSREKIDQNIAPLIARGLSIVPVVADVSTDEGVAAAMQEVRRTKGTLYGLANVAGGAAGSTWMRATRVTRTLAVELALDNIRVNAFAPGTTITPGAGAYIDEDVERDRRAIAMGRRARPDEQAGISAEFWSNS